MKTITQFKTRKEVDAYLGGNTIKCLICGRRMQALNRHIRISHNVTADEYREMLGLPWSRGLCSSLSSAKMGVGSSKYIKANRQIVEERLTKARLINHGIDKYNPRPIPPFIRAELPWRMLKIGSL